MIYEVYQILNANLQDDKHPSFNVGRILPDGNKIAKCNLKKNPDIDKNKFLTAEQVRQYIKKNYPDLFDVSV